MEQLIAVIFGIFVFCIVLYGLYARGMDADLVRNRVNTVAKSTQQDFVLDEEMNKPLADRFVKPMLRGLIIQVKRILPKNNNSDKGNAFQKQDKLRNQLRQAGLHMDSSEFRAIQILAAAILAVIFGGISFILTGRIQSVLLFVLIGMYFGYVGLRFYIARRVTSRHESMRRMLPEVLDMLSVSVEAGLGLEQAILQVNNHFNGPLIDELSIAYREMSMGRTRKDALMAMAERCQVEEVNSFVRAVVQAGQMGISIKNVLRSQAEFMRQTRRNKIEEKAMQVSVKILIPMAIFIFPVMFIILLGPAAVAIFEQMM